MSDFLEKFEPTDEAWFIEEDGKEAKKRKLYEALFTISNAYVGMRGINEDMPTLTTPGTFIAGAFDKSECVAVEMVNFPNPMALYLVIDGQKVDLDHHATSHRRRLDLKHGALFRETVFVKDGRETRFRSIRFVSMHDRNIAMSISEITPLNWTGELTLVTELDGSVHNAFGNWFPEEWLRHLHLVSINDNYDHDTIMMVQTRDRGHYYCIASSFDLPGEAVARRKKIFGEQVKEEVTLQVHQGTPVNAFKYISFEDSRHVDGKELVKATTHALNRAKLRGSDDLWDAHRQKWGEKWAVADIRVNARDDSKELSAKIRFNLYHLIIHGSEGDYRHGIGIKGFTGEMYRGHYFWDTEMYMFPFFLYTNPVIARNLLVFRHSLLDRAKQNAKERGYRGLVFSWECDELGNEGINHEMDREMGVMRRREVLDQYHLNLAVMNAVFRYYEATGDFEYMVNYGADLVVENMRFWDSFLVWNAEKDRFDAIQVMGPDEYHANINNNYYTNYLLKAIAQKTTAFFNWCGEYNQNAYYKITRRLSVTTAELDQWREISEKICLMEPTDGVLEQFEGYFKLADYTFTKRNEFGIPMVEELEPLKDPSHPVYTPDLVSYHEALVRMASRMRIIKQADTLMLFYLFPFDFPAEVIKNTFYFYEARTLHYSSLSPAIYAICAARFDDHELAGRYFNLSLNMDLQDIKKESENALHTPTSGEVYSIIVQGYAGVFPRGDRLVVDPHLPPGWKSIEFKYRWRGVLLSFVIGKNKLKIASSGPGPVQLTIRGEAVTVMPQGTVIINGKGAITMMEQANKEPVTTRKRIAQGAQSVLAAPPERTSEKGSG
ncbi:MAG: glycosyl hydrolase family 65 protein [Anaerolineales bacterium]|jgi:kojibiose phosphorylase